MGEVVSRGVERGWAAAAVFLAAARVLGDTCRSAIFALALDFSDFSPSFFLPKLKSFRIEPFSLSPVAFLLTSGSTSLLLDDAVFIRAEESAKLSPRRGTDEVLEDLWAEGSGLTARGLALVEALMLAGEFSDVGGDGSRD